MRLHSIKTRYVTLIILIDQGVKQQTEQNPNINRFKVLDGHHNLLKFGENMSKNPTANTFSPRVECQISGKPNHTTIKCWYTYHLAHNEEEVLMT